MKEYRLTVRLHPERDADLIHWIEQSEKGCRSQGIRDMLRVGLGLTRQHQLLADLDNLRQVVRTEMQKALNGVEFLKPTTSTSEGKRAKTESQFGSRLDNMMRSL